MTSAQKPESQPAVRPGRPGNSVPPPAAARIANQRRFPHRPRATPPPRPEAEVAALRELARTAGLGAALAAADREERRRLHAGAYAVVHPIVFQVVTRKVERQRGHGGCARGLRHLSGACLDSFHDDVESVIEHLFTSRTAIDDLEAWLAFWTPRAVVNGHRRRRGELGALQRPRMTKALAARLGHDPWLMALALQILTWVGIPTTAGPALWPVDEWAQLRARTTGDFPGSTAAVVAGEIEQVLAALRRQPGWYAAHVERPLGHKPAPVASEPATEPPTGLDDVEDGHAAVLAWTALEAITAGLAQDREPTETVVEVLSTLFLGGSGAEAIGRAPGAGPADDERISALLADPAALARVVDGVLRIVRETDR